MSYMCTYLSFSFFSFCVFLSRCNTFHTCAADTRIFYEHFICYARKWILLKLTKSEWYFLLIIIQILKNNFTHILSVRYKRKIIDASLAWEVIFVEAEHDSYIYQMSSWFFHKKKCLLVSLFCPFLEVKQQFFFSVVSQRLWWCHNWEIYQTNYFCIFLVDYQLLIYIIVFRILIIDFLLLSLVLCMERSFL